MRPVFRLVADGKDITALINDRLLMLRTSDKPGMESDEFELRIDDRDQAVALPSRGAHIEVLLGYSGKALARLGRYTVDEVELSGPPDTLVIRGKASDMRGSGKTTRSGSWEGVPLQQIVGDLAARNGWQPVCPVATKVPRIDQLNESDFNFITRLAKQYDCTAKVGDGKLLVLPRQGGQSASGKALGMVTITRQDVSRYQFRLSDKSSQRLCRPGIRTRRAVRCRRLIWATRMHLMACRRCIPTDISTRTSPPLSRPPRRAWPRSTAARPACAWRWRGVLTCLPSA